MRTDLKKAICVSPFYGGASGRRGRPSKERCYDGRKCGPETVQQAPVLQRPAFSPEVEMRFDVVVCFEVLEHLDREDSCQLLSELAETARRQVIVSTPLGKYDQAAYDGNPAQLHRYLWSHPELKEMGYRVVTLGLRNLGGDSGLASRLPAALHLLSDGVWVLAGPFTRFLPRLAGEMVAVKNLGGPKSTAN